MNNVYIVSYDITNNKLRRKIEKLLKNFGIRIQYSVFCCRLDNDGAQRLREHIADTVDTYAILCQKDDNIAVIGGISEKTVNFVLGEQRMVKSYMIY